MDFTDKEKWIIEENAHEPIISREELLGKQKLLADKITKLKVQIDLVQEKMDGREIHCRTFKNWAMA